MKPNELAVFIRQFGKNCFENPDEIADTIQWTAKNSYYPPPVIADSLKQMLAISNEYHPLAAKASERVR